MDVAFLICFAICSSDSPTFSEFLGVNGHTITFNADQFRPVVRHVRDYHPFDWDVGKDSSGVPPFPFAANRVDWNKVYGSWHSAQQTPHVCLIFDNFKRESWKDLSGDADRYGEQFARA